MALLPLHCVCWSKKINKKKFILKCICKVKKKNEVAQTILSSLTNSYRTVRFASQTKTFKLLCTAENQLDQGFKVHSYG